MTKPPPTLCNTATLDNDSLCSVTTNILFDLTVFTSFTILSDYHLKKKCSDLSNENTKLIDDLVS